MWTLSEQRVTAYPPATPRRLCQTAATRTHCTATGGADCQLKLNYTSVFMPTEAEFKFRVFCECVIDQLPWLAACGLQS